MPMGIVSDEEFNSELSNVSKDTSETREKLNSDSDNVTIIDMVKGRGPNPQVPDSLRKIIGEESVINGRQAGLEIAKQFGVSPSSVSAYANGSHSTATYDERPNVSHINDAVTKVVTRARSKMMKAMSHITDDKLKDAKPRDLAGIAKDMSAVIRNMEPEKTKDPNEKTGPAFIFYAPQFRDERSFDTIYAKE